MDNLTPWWTVVGVWPDFGDSSRSKRWMGNYQALTPRIAEDIARMEAQEAWEATGRRGVAAFWVTGVFEGQLTAADSGYATYVDPDQVD